MKRKILKKIGLTLLIGSGWITTNALEQTAVKTVAISQIVEHEALDETYRGIVDELKAQGYIKGTNLNLLYETAHGSPLMASQIAQKYAGMKPDIMVGIGTLAAQSLASADRTKRIPIVFSSVTDPVAAQLVVSLTNPGCIITGVSNWVPLEPQLAKFKEILPSLKRLGIIYNPGEGNSVILVNRLKAIGPANEIEVIESPATLSMEVSTATEHIARKVDAIFISNDNTALSAFESIVNVAKRAGIPIFVSDTAIVKRGAAAAFGPDQYEIGRQTGKIIVGILKGTTPTQIPVEFPDKSEFFLNLDALEAVHLKLTDKLIQEAKEIIQKNKTTVSTSS